MAHFLVFAALLSDTIRYSCSSLRSDCWEKKSTHKVKRHFFPLCSVSLCFLLENFNNSFDCQRIQCSASNKYIYARKSFICTFSNYVKYTTMTSKWIIIEENVIEVDQIVVEIFLFLETKPLLNKTKADEMFLRLVLNRNQRLHTKINVLRLQNTSSGISIIFSQVTELWKTLGNSHLYNLGQEFSSRLSWISLSVHKTAKILYLEKFSSIWKMSIWILIRFTKIQKL